MINKKNLLNIIEGLVLVGLLVFVIVIMSSGSAKDVPMSQIESSMLQLEGISDMIRKDAAGVKSSMGIVPGEYIYFRTDDIMDVRELFIARAADDSEMDRIEEGVSGHLAEQIDNFTGYGTNQIDLLNHAVSMKRGNYYFFAVGENADQWQAAFIKIIS